MKRLGRLWLRYLLWYNHICPKHGRMRGGWRTGGQYCARCSAEREERISKVCADREIYVDELFKAWKQ